MDNINPEQRMTYTRPVNMKFAYCLTTKNLSLYLLLAAKSMIGMMMVAAVDDAADDDTDATANKARRDLEASCASTAAYHPDYSLPWNQGKCDLTITCYSTSYATELACCKAEYAGQDSGYCISQLDNPPTSSPTKKGGSDAWYPDYSLAWSEGKCINTVPRPNNANPMFPSQLACCKSAYAGQLSNACIAALANPPTSGPMKLGGPDAWYPDYSLAWPERKCINTVPRPNNANPIFPSQLACCESAYVGLSSKNACIAALANQPTSGPTANPSSTAPTATTDAPTSPSPTTSVPTINPACFLDKAALVDAVNTYIGKDCTNNPSDADCVNLSNSRGSPIGKWCTSLITDMSFLFSDRYTFNEDISEWNVGSVADMSSMFNGAYKFNQNITKWNVGSVTNMANMFDGATDFNQDISGWNVGLVTNMAGMFHCRAPTFFCLFNQDIGDWNVTLVTDMASMFRGASAFNQNIGEWNVASVTNMANMFDSASAFNQNIGGWNVGSVTNMAYMFAVTDFNQDIGGWNVASVTDMGYMFQGAYSFNQDISGWNVASVTNMEAMFNSAIAFDQNIGGWNVGSVTYMDYMFYGASAFNQNLCAWNVIPSIRNTDMFVDSGCADKVIPSFCAASCP